jgi:hypothetical protein
MTQSLRLRGTELRYVLTWHLFLHGPATVPELLQALRYYNFDVGGRGSKSISDALRWERRYGRVGRWARGRYGPGWMPRGTEYRIHKRVLALRAQAAELSLGGGQNDMSSDVRPPPNAARTPRAHCQP